MSRRVQPAFLRRRALVLGACVAMFGLASCGGTKTDTGGTTTESDTPTNGDDTLADTGTTADTGTSTDTSSATDTQSGTDAITSDIPVTGQTGNVTVTVRNAAGLPVSKATLKIGANPPIVTGVNGEATLKDLPNSPQVVIVSANGYAEAAGTVLPIVGKTVDLWVKVASVDALVVLDPGQAVAASAASVAVSAPAAAFTYPDGTPVTTPIQLAVTTIDPTTSELATAPGPLKEVKADGSAGSALAAIAMADLTFTAGGQKVQLKAGEKANVSFTVPASLASAYPDGTTIDSYWFDPVAGAWRKGASGTAMKDATGKVAVTFAAEHFTWWMVAKPIASPGCFNVTVTLDGAPIAGADIEASSWGAGALSKAASGSTGSACLEGVAGTKAYIAAKFGSATSLVEAPAPAAGTCGATCTDVTVALDSGTACIDYTVTGQKGGKLVFLTDKGGAGGITVPASGTGCLSVPKGATVTLVASSGTAASAAQKINALAASACGGGGCTKVALDIPTVSLPVAATACGSAPDGTGCDDGDACTQGDVCLGGQCAGTPNVCNDGNICTQNGCDSQTGKCNFVAVAGCVAGGGCTGNAAACLPVCQIDGPAIASALADALAACVKTACAGSADPDCATKAPATTCAKQNGMCQGADTDKDGDPDLTDCVANDASVSHLALESCNGKDDNCDGLADDGETGCGAGKVCVAAACVIATPANGCQSDLDCDDGQACTLDLCANFACAHAAIAGCVACNASTDCPKPSDACNTFECAFSHECQLQKVAGVSCSGGCAASAECNDGQACTDDFCVNGTCKNLPSQYCGIAANGCQSVWDCVGKCLQGGSNGLKACLSQCEAGQNAATLAASQAVGSCILTACPDDKDVPCLMNAHDVLCQAQVQGCKGKPACAADGDCDDGNPCTKDQCNGDSCSHWNNNGDPQCQGTGGCQSNTDCADSDPCTDGFCKTSICFSVPNSSTPGCGVKCAGPSDCSDGNLCTDDLCNGGICANMDNPTAPGCGAMNCSSSADCDDKDPCTMDSCSIGLCVHQPSGAPGCGGPTMTCSDAIQCFMSCTAAGQPAANCNSQCASGLVGGDAAAYAQLNSCLTATCAPGDMPCLTAAVTGACAAPFAACGGGAPGCTSPAQCDDGNPCTDDACSAGQCQHIPNTTNPSCGGGSCKSDVDCDDGNVCTGDVCGGGTCYHALDYANPACQGACANVGDCYLATPCQNTACVSGKCAYTDDTSKPGCCKLDTDCKADADPCTNDSCVNGFCNAKIPGCGPCTVATDCNDGDACTVNQCTNGQCAYAADNTVPGCCKADTDCPDADACTKDQCVFGTCYHSKQAGCGACAADGDCYDSNTCTSDVCTAGQCVHQDLCVKCTTTADCAASNLCATCTDYNAPGYCSVSTTNNAVKGCAKQCSDDASCDDGDACTTDACQPLSWAATKLCAHAKKANCGPEKTCSEAAACYSKCVGSGATSAYCAGYCAPSDATAATTFGTMTACFATNSGLGTNCTKEMSACGGTCQADADCPSANGCLVGTCTAGTCGYSATAGCTECAQSYSCPFDPTGCKTTTCDAGKCGQKTTLPYPSGCQACVVETDCTTEVCRVKTCEAGKCNVSILPEYAPCEDGNACTGTGGDKDHCMYGTCYPGAQDFGGAVCNDSNPCTLDDKCEPFNGVCGGTAKCDDANGCTLDVCDPATLGCTHSSADGAACDDGEYCTDKDLCANSACVAGGPTSCPADNPCQINGVCTPGMGNSVGYSCSFTPLSCPSDGNDCTFETCQPFVGCITTSADNYVCGLGNCNYGMCGNSTCTSTNILPCDDGNACTEDLCAPPNVGQYCGPQPIADGAPCDDGAKCTASDACTGGKCAGAAVACDDSNPCTDDSCDPMTGACIYAANTAPCSDDNNVCTDDVCSAKACIHNSNTLPCPDDGNGCTNDVCAASTCTHPNNTATCDVGPCTDDVCSGGVCTVGPANTAPCEDGEPCTAGDTCAGGVCQPGAAKNCEDNNDCTSQACVMGKGCVYTPLSNALNCDKGCKLGDPVNYPGCKDCGGYGCYGELLGAHYCGNPAGSYKGLCQP